MKIHEIEFQKVLLIIVNVVRIPNPTTFTEHIIHWSEIVFPEHLNQAESILCNNIHTN